MWLPVLIEGVVLVLITLGLMHYFGSLKTMRWYVMVTVFAGWFFVFSVVVLLPNDISGALYRACLNRTLEWNEGEPPQAECEEPISLVTEQFLYYAWEANYWTAFALSWAVGPLMQSYVLAGGFTFPQKAWQSIKENLILYGVLLTIGVVMLIYIGVQKNFDMEAIMGFVMAMANAYGLFFVICFLGYGLVDVPRRLWRYGNRERELRYLEFKAPEVKDTVDDTAVELVETIRRINTLDRKVSMQHQFRKYVDILVSKCPSDREKYGADRDSGGEVTKKELMNLNAKITEARRFKHRADVLWHQLLLEAFRLQDVLENRKSSTRMYTSDLWKKNMRTARERLLRRVEWYWHVWVVPLSSRSLAVVCGLFSLLIVWCEVTMFSEHPVLSVYNILLHTDDVHIFYNYLVVLISVGYMSVCAYSSLMKVRLFNYYYLVGNHQTDENSLLFCAAYLSRLTFPLTYNFSLMAGVDGTVFQRVLGKMELLPLFGLGFNTYFPILVSVICFLVLFDVFGRLLRLCNIQRFNFSRNMDESHVEEGREYIRRARERAVRHPDLFFSGVTELPSERPSRKTPVQSISTSLGVPESSESNLDDESIEGSSSTLMGRMSNLFSGIKDRAQGKNTGPSLGGSKDKSMQRNLLPKHHSASASSSTSSSSSGIPLRSVPQFNTSVVSLREEDDLDDILNADPLVPSYASRLRSNKPQKNFFSDV